MAGELFNLFDLFVVNTFGGLFMTYIGLFVVFAVIGIISSMSPTLLITLLIFYTSVFLTGYFGGIMAVFFLIISLVYFMSSLLNFINKFRG
jgi:hypothetical protein